MSKGIETEANVVFSKTQPNMGFIYQGSEHVQWVMRRFLRVKNVVRFCNYFLSTHDSARIGV